MEAARPAAAKASDLLAWYDRHRRSLPWRRDRHPYRVWVSEIMLQQTRVDSVVAYYERFLERFPDVEVLARADEEEVLAAWSGLGYYRRARLLHAAARRLVAAGGGWPADSASWRELPGIGEYTAAALASIVDGEVTPVLDGNVERVLSRYLAAEGNPKHRELRRRLTRVAKGMLDDDRPGDSNQALMELGATVCRPLHPLCHRCPLASGCRARAAGEPERYPPPRRRRELERVRRRAFFVAGGDERIWLVRRDEAESLLAGFWEFPWLDVARTGRTGDRLAEKYGGQWTIGERRGVVRHAITHRRFEVTVELAARRSDSVQEGDDRGFFAPLEIDSLATSSLTRKIAAAAGVPAIAQS